MPAKKSGGNPDLGRALSTYSIKAFFDETYRNPA
jgi:hypothetical protein